jgi:hypothetical protein
MFDSSGRCLDGEHGWRSRIESLPPLVLAQVESSLDSIEARRRADAERDSRDREADLAAGRVAPTPEERERREEDRRELAALRADEAREDRAALERHERERPKRIEELLARAVSALEALTSRG